MNISKRDERDLLIFAFRYALGRMTFSALTVSGVILDNWDDISDADKKLFKREITEAIDGDRAGMECDIAQWQKVLDKK